MARRLWRFLFLEPRRAAPAAAVDPRRAERERELRSGLELAEPSDELPFVRCAYCGTDHTRYATECRTCGRSLATPGQREFNLRLTDQRRAESARERQEQAGRPDQPGPLRSAHEELARAALEQDDELVAAQASLGLRLLRAIPDRSVRWSVAAGLCAGGAVSTWGLFHGDLSVSAALLELFFLVVLATFAPPRRRR